MGGHWDRYIGSLFRVDEPVPDDSHPSNQAKKLLNNKKLPKSLAVSFIFLTFATTFARVRGHGDRYIGSLFMVDEPVPDDLEPTNNHNQKVILVIIKKK